MMRDLHVTDHASRIGFYSGLVVSYPELLLYYDLEHWFQDSVFAISQLFSIYHWGKLSGKLLLVVIQLNPDCWQTGSADAR